MSFADKVKKLIDEAPEVTGRTNVNFGPATFTPIVVSWAQRDENNRPVKTPLWKYMKDNKIGENDDLLLSKDESFQLHIDIDITEFNPSLDFHYERDVAIRESNKSNKDSKKWMLTNWSEILHPSLEAVFGKKWYDKILADGKKEAPVFYVAVEDVETVEPVKEGKKSYGVPKIIAVYKNAEECRKARDEHYPPRDQEAEMAFGPDDEEEEAEEGSGEEGFSEEVLEQVRDLYNSTKKNVKQTLKMLESDPFDIGEHDPKELFKAALPDVVVK